MDELTTDVRRRLSSAPPRRIEALSLNQSLSGVDAWLVWAETGSGRWSARDERTGTHVEFDGRGLLSDAYGSRDVGIAFRPHPAVQLLFPERLFVWGEEGSDWVPSWSEPGDDGFIVIGLSHRTDRSLLASLTYHVDDNLIVRFDSPSNSVHLRDVTLVPA